LTNFYRNAACLPENLPTLLQEQDDWRDRQNVRV